MALPSRARTAALSAVGLLAALAPALATAQVSLGQAQISAHDTAAIALARALVTAVMEGSGTPGMSVAVGVDGRIVWSEGFGYADVENRVPVWPETMFRIGSVSKPLTAAAVGRLVEEGRLELDLPVQRYVPTFPRKRWPITTRQVAGHLAGIRNYTGNDEWLSARHYDSVLDGLQIFANDTLLFAPGTRYSYTTYGWSLVSAVIEGASGERFLPYMQRHVFDRLGMTHTAPDHVDSIIPHRTRYYQRDQSLRVLNAPYVDNSNKWAGGGFLSTPEDLVRFAFAHFGDGYLRRETIQLLWTPQRTNTGASTGYGIGWGVTLENGAVVEATHPGGSVGGTAAFVAVPPRRAAIAVVGNMSSAPTEQIARPILEAFLDPAAIASPGTGPDITGDYTCALRRGADEVARAEVRLGGSPAGYWGRFVWSNRTIDRIVRSFSSPSETRLVTVDGGANVLTLRFTRVGAGVLEGEWRSGIGGQATCQRR